MALTNKYCLISPVRHQVQPAKAKPTDDESSGLDESLDSQESSSESGSEEEVP